MDSQKPTVGVYKFSSCDGCQLAFLNAGESLLKIAAMTGISHFAEAGIVDTEAHVDIAFVEGSITTPDEVERIQHIREHARHLVTIGACATSGGIQALRNGAEDSADWMSAVYASPEYIASLETSTAISRHVKVDLELWGCPVTTRQIVEVVQNFLLGVKSAVSANSVCMECKRQGNVCVLVARGVPCMGPVTRSGCGALCPSYDRDCYGCFGPSELADKSAHSRVLAGLGLMPHDIKHRFHFIYSAEENFSDKEPVPGETSHE